MYNNRGNMHIPGTLDYKPQRLSQLNDLCYDVAAC